MRRNDALAAARRAVRAMPAGAMRTRALAALEDPDLSSSARLAAAKEYAKTHWGAPGKARLVESRCADPGASILVKLGRLTYVEYETTKRGDPPRTFYQHDFARPYPELTYSTEDDGGGLVIVGGGYTVTKHGIVG